MSIEANKEEVQQLHQTHLYYDVHIIYGGYKRMSKPVLSKIMSLTLLIVFLFTVFFVPSCDAYSTNDIHQTRSGKTLVVNATGEGDYTRIQWAVDNASDGDTVLVESGIYIEQITINKSISLVGNVDECIIDGNRSGTVITVSSDGVEIMGLTVKGSSGQESAIFLDEVQNCTIKGNNITKNSRGIGIEGCNNKIENNIFYGNGWAGISLWGNNNIILNNTCQYSEAGIEVGSSENHITGNTLKFGIWGIRLDYAENNVITNNHCTNYQDGILLSDSDKNTISNNECNSNIYNGIDLDNSKKNKVTSNTCISNGLYGIFIIDQDDKGNLDSKGAGNKLSYNICESNGEANIYYESDEDEDRIFTTIIIAIIIIIVSSMVLQLLFNLKEKR